MAKLAAAAIATLFLTLALDAPRLWSANNLYTFGGFNGWPTALHERVSRGDVLYVDVVWPLPPLVPWLYELASRVLGARFGIVRENVLSILFEMVIALVTLILCMTLGLSWAMSALAGVSAGTMVVMAHQTMLYDVVSLAFGWAGVSIAAVLAAKTRRDWLAWSGAGVCLALAVLAKQSTGLFVSAAVLVSVLLLGGTGGSVALKRAGGLLLGIGAVSCAVISVLWRQGALEGFLRYVVAGGVANKGGPATVFDNALDFLRFQAPRFQVSAFVAGLGAGAVAGSPALERNVSDARANSRPLRRPARVFDLAVAGVCLAVAAVWAAALNFLQVNFFARFVRLLQFDVLILHPLVVGLVIGVGLRGVTTGARGPLPMLLAGALALAAGRCVSGDMVFNLEATALGFVPLAMCSAEGRGGLVGSGMRAWLAVAAVFGALSVSAHNSVFLDHDLSVPVRAGKPFPPAGVWSKVPEGTAEALSEVGRLASEAPCTRNGSCRCVFFADPILSVWFGCVEDQRSFNWYTDMFDDSLLPEERSRLAARPPDVIGIPRGVESSDDAGVGPVVEKLRTIRLGSAAERLYGWLVRDFLPREYDRAGRVDISGMNGYARAGVVFDVFWRRPRTQKPPTGSPLWP